MEFTEHKSTQLIKHSFAKWPTLNTKLPTYHIEQDIL